MNWQKFPDTKPSLDHQAEVVFYKKPYEWLTGIFTPKGRFGAKQDMFEWHDSQGDDKCHLIENVIAYIILPEPLK
jgi:hypothetical protein